MGQDIGSQAGDPPLAPADVPDVPLSESLDTAVLPSPLSRTLSAIRDSLRESLFRGFLTRQAAMGSQGPSVENLVQLHRLSHPRANMRQLRGAFVAADRAHQGQTRKSGEPYITHPLAVAEILAELGMDTVTLIAALLHDTVEDTHYTLGQIRNEFGDDVAHLVDGVTKLDKVHFGKTVEVETTRKMILAASRDVRVLVIKLADRLHNMRTLGAKSRASQMRIAQVTREILVPLAGRLGVQMIKRELEDLALAALDPELYAQIECGVAAQRSRRRAFVATLRGYLSPWLRAEKIRAQILDRPRHYMSIYERHASVKAAHADFRDDPRIVLVVDGDVADCYAALGVVHSHWRPIPGRFKDFIAVPKFNLYKSLHTTVLGPENQLVDVMIRTREMHRVAEYGIADRCRVSRVSRASNGECESSAWSDDSVELEWLRRLLEWQHEAESDLLLESLRYDLSDHEVTVFTAQGHPVSLPHDSTPVDLAYGVDTMLGDRCVGARVNGQLAPLSCPLADGDVVEILVSPSGYAGPERAWLEFARSSRARLRILRWFEGHDPVSEEHTHKAGKRAIAEALFARERLLMHEQPLIVVARAMGLSDAGALYRAVAQGSIAAEAVVDRAIGLVDGA